MGYWYSHSMAVQPLKDADYDKITKWMTTGYEAVFDWTDIFGLGDDGCGTGDWCQSGSTSQLYIWGDRSKCTIDENDLKRLGKAFPNLTFKIMRSGELPLDYVEMYVHGETVEIIRAKIDPPEKVEW